VSWEFVAIGVFSPVLAWIASWLIAKAEARRVHQRLKLSPFVFPKATFSRVLEGGAEIFPAGRVASLERGRIVLETMDGAERLEMTLAEFENCHAPCTSTDQEILMAEDSGRNF